MLPEEQQALRRIQSSRLKLWLLLAGYIPVFLLGNRFIHSNLVVIAIMLAWLIAIVHMVAVVAFSHCPRCRNYFHATTGTPSFWNLFARSCTHCGLPLRSGKVVYPSME